MKTVYTLSIVVLGFVAMGYPELIYQLNLPEWTIIGGGILLFLMLAADLAVSKKLEGKRGFGPGAFLCVQLGIIPVVVIPDEMSQWAVVAYTLSYALPALAAFSGFVWDDFVSYYGPLDEDPEAKGAK